MNSNEKSFYQVNHFTEISYSDSIRENIFILTMKPIETAYQKIQNYNLKIEPKAKLFSYKDWYGNNKHFFNILLSHKNLKIHSSFKVSVEKAGFSPASREKLESSYLQSPGSSKKPEKNIKQIHVWDWMKESYFTRNCKELEIFLKEENIKKTR